MAKNGYLFLCFDNDGFDIWMAMLYYIFPDFPSQSYFCLPLTPWSLRFFQRKKRFVFVSNAFIPERKNEIKGISELVTSYRSQWLEFLERENCDKLKLVFLECNPLSILITRWGPLAWPLAYLGNLQRARDLRSQTMPDKYQVLR